MTTATARAVIAILICSVLTWTGGAPTAAADAPGVAGRVTFESAAVNGAVVELLSGGIVVGNTTTGSTGGYEIVAPAAGTFDVLVTPPTALGVMAQTIRGVVVPGAPTVAAVDVALRRPLGSVRVRLLDESPTALSGLRVRLVTRSAGVSVVDLGVTDATGRVELRAPGGVDYGLRIDVIPGSPPSLPADFALRLDQAVRATTGGSDIVLTLPVAVLDVTTTRSGGASVDNVVVAARGAMAGLDLGGGLTGTGSFEASGTTSSGGVVSLPAMRQALAVEAFPRDALLVGASTSVNVAAAPTPRTAVTLTLADAPTASLSLTLLDGAGERVPGATVSATTSATTGVDGEASVVVRTDRPTGVNVRTNGAGGLDLPDRLVYTRVVPPVVSETLRPTLADLAVTVVDVTSGAPISGAVVTITSPLIDSGAWSVRSTENARPTDALGVAVFRLVPGGAYGVTVRVAANRIGSETVTLAGGGTGVTVPLPPASTSTSVTSPATVTGRIVTPAGDGVAGLSVQSTVGGTIGTTASDGTFTVRIDASMSQGLRIKGSQLLERNVAGVEVPDQLDVRTASVPVLSSAPAVVALGDIELPLDRLELQVSDETGGGLFALVARSPLTGTRTVATIGGASVAVFASSGYVDRGIRLDDFGDGTMHLFSGPREVTVDEESATNFPDIDLPVTEAANLTAGPDVLRLVLTRRFGAPVTTLTGSPLVSATPTMLELELPDAVLTPIVELPGPLANATTSTQVVLLDRYWCDEEVRTIVADPAACPGGDVMYIELIESGIPPQLGPGAYPVAVRSSAVITGVPDVGTVFVQEGYRRSTLVLVPPSDSPPVLSGVDDVPAAPEGSLALLFATASDAEGSVVVSWDLDGDGLGDIEGASVWIDVPDGPSVTSIGTIVTDSAGRSVRGGVEVESVNVAPTATLTVGSPDPSGIVVVTVDDLDDPSGVDRETLVVELDRDGDGTYETLGVTTTIDASALADGTYSVAARVSDKDGGVVLLRGSFDVQAATPSTTGPVDPEPTSPTEPTTPSQTTTPTPTTPLPTTPGPVPSVAIPSPAVGPAVIVSDDPLGARLPETGGAPFGPAMVALGLLALGAVVAATSRRPSA